MTQTQGAAESHLAAVCQGMASIVARQEAFPTVPIRPPDPYPSLVRAVVFQQLSGKAAETIFRRVLALFPDVAFPTPAQLMAADTDTLRAAGLSRQKIAAIQDIARKTEEGVIPPAKALNAMSDDEIIAALTTARGVGRWTVEMHLIFAMGRPDVLPTDDLGVRKGAERLFGRTFDKKQLAVFGERWGPWRSAAAWHLWRLLDTPTV
jgi:DNA-3-methyladenine glycosylase II